MDEINCCWCFLQYVTIHWLKEDFFYTRGTTTAQGTTRRDGEHSVGPAIGMWKGKWSQRWGTPITRTASRVPGVGSLFLPGRRWRSPAGRSSVSDAFIFPRAIIILRPLPPPRLTRPHPLRPFMIIPVSDHSYSIKSSSESGVRIVIDTFLGRFFK
jgi:hypothetical protein